MRCHAQLSAMPCLRCTCVNQKITIVPHERLQATHMHGAAMALHSATWYACAYTACSMAVAILLSLHSMALFAHTHAHSGPLVSTITAQLPFYCARKCTHWHDHAGRSPLPILSAQLLLPYTVSCPEARLQTSRWPNHQKGTTTWVIKPPGSGCSCVAMTGSHPSGPCTCCQQHRRQEGHALHTACGLTARCCYAN